MEACCMESHPSVDNRWYSFSKGTQSEGLTSDSSSSDESKLSSMRNSHQSISIERSTDVRSEKITKGLHNRSLTSLIHKVSSLSVANVSKGSNNGKSMESTESLCSKLWLNWDNVRVKRLRYFQWSILLSFGAGLWAALCIADVFQSNAFINKEGMKHYLHVMNYALSMTGLVHFLSKKNLVYSKGWIADMVTAKKITAKAEIIKKPASHVWWFINLWNYAWRTVMSTSALEAFMLLSCFVVMVYVEGHVRKKLEDRRNSHTQFDRSVLRQVRTVSEETDNYHFSKCSHFRMFEEEISLSRSDDNNLKTWLAIELSEQKNASGDIKVGSTSSWQTEPHLSLEQTAYRVMNNNEPTPIKNSVSLMNEQSWSWEEQVGKNMTNSCNNISSDCAIKNELELHKSYAHKIDQSKLSCERIDSNWMKVDDGSTTSLQKFYTQTDSLNLNYVDDVTHTFNLEIEEYLKVENKSSIAPSREITRYLRQLRSSDCNQCDDSRIKNFLMDGVDINAGIISSSPAFQKFLLNLQEGKFSCPKQFS